MTGTGIEPGDEIWDWHPAPQVEEEIELWNLPFVSVPGQPSFSYSRSTAMPEIEWTSGISVEDPGMRRALLGAGRSPAPPEIQLAWSQLSRSASRLVGLLWKRLRGYKAQTSDSPACEPATEIWFASTPNDTPSGRPIPYLEGSFKPRGMVLTATQLADMAMGYPVERV